MKIALKHLGYFLAPVLLLMACSQEKEVYFQDSEEYADFTFDLGLDPEDEMTRDYASEQAAYESLFNTLVCQVFDAKGDRVVINPEPKEQYYADREAYEEAVATWSLQGKKAEEIRIKNFRYKNAENPTRVNLRMIKGLEYTICLWVQRGGEDPEASIDPEAPAKDLGDRYYYTFDDENKDISLKNMQVHYGHSDRVTATFLNNDFDREAFCFSYPIILYEKNRSKTFDLRRPFAQINFGIEDAELEKLMGEGYDLKDIRTAIHLYGTANWYDVSRGHATSRDPEGIVEPEGQEALYELNEIPTAQNPAYRLKGSDRNSASDVDGQLVYDAKYDCTWLSMTFLLPLPKISGRASYVDVNLEIKYKNDSGKEMTKVLRFKNMPVLANYRTNYILTADEINAGESKDEDDV